MTFIKSQYKPNIPSETEVANDYLSSIYNQVMRLGYNFIGLTVGRPQAGKSMFTGGALCSLLDPTYFDHLEERTVYDANSFMREINKIIKRGQLGRAIMWDEAGIGIPARQWYDISNKAISFCVQVAGVFRPFIFFVTQDMTYIDSQPRKLINALFEVTRTTNKYSTTKVFNISIDRRRGKAYFKYPKMITKDGVYIKISKGIKYAKPPKEFIKRYLDHSKPYKQKITEMMEQRTEDFDIGKIKKNEMSVSEIVQHIIDDDTGIYKMQRSSPGNTRFNRNLIQYDFNVPMQLAAVVKAQAEHLTNKKFATPLDE